MIECLWAAHAEPVPIPGRHWRERRRDLRRHVCACPFLRSGPARDHSIDPARQARQAALRGAMARTARPSDGKLIDLFLDMLAAERGAGENTLSAYRRDLEDFAGHLAGMRRTIGGAGTEDIRSYLGALTKRGFAAASVARRLSAIRQLYRFLYTEGHRGDDPAAIIEGPKRGRALPKVLSIEQVDNLLEHARAQMKAGSVQERLRAARLACLLEVLY